MLRVSSFIILNILIVFLLNIFSNHIFFFNSVGNLLIIVILAIILLFSFFISSLKGSFLIIKRNEIYKQYYSKLLKLYYIFYLYKNILIQNISICLFQNHYFKFIILLYKLNSTLLLNIIKYFNNYLYNNYLNNYYINNYLIESFKTKLVYKLFYKNYIFIKFFNRNIQSKKKKVYKNEFWI